MLMKSEFIEVFNEFNDDWNGKYSGRQIAKLYDYCKRLEPYELRRELDHLDEAHSRAPTVGQIKSALRPAVNRASERHVRAVRAKLRASGKMCPYCDLNGVMSAFDTKGNEFAFRCNKCDAAEAIFIGGNFPHYSRHEHSHLEVRPIRKIIKLDEFEKNKGNPKALIDSLVAGMPKLGGEK